MNYIYCDFKVNGQIIKTDQIKSEVVTSMDAVIIDGIKYKVLERLYDADDARFYIVITPI